MEGKPRRGFLLNRQRGNTPRYMERPPLHRRPRTAGQNLATPGESCTTPHSAVSGRSCITTSGALTEKGFLRRTRLAFPALFDIPPRDFSRNRPPDPAGRPTGHQPPSHTISSASFPFNGDRKQGDMMPVREFFLLAGYS